METITLNYPITCEGREIKTLEMRRPKTKEVFFAKKQHKNEEDANLSLMATLCGLPPSAIEDLDVGDFMAANSVLQGFFG